MRGVGGVGGVGGVVGMDGGMLLLLCGIIDLRSAPTSEEPNVLVPIPLLLITHPLSLFSVSRQVLEPANQRLYRDVTLGQYLVRHKYSRTFTYNYVVPMCAAVWSVPNANVREEGVMHGGASSMDGRHGRDLETS